MAWLQSAAFVLANLGGLGLLGVLALRPPRAQPTGPSRRLPGRTTRIARMKPAQRVLSPTPR